MPDNIDPYSTHLPALKAVFSSRKINSVFEFGTGEYSTQFFCDNATEVVSCEMQDETWFHRMRNKHANDPHVDIRCLLGKTPAIAYLEELDLRFDLIFVDGHGWTRWAQVNTAKRFTDVIVAHDTEDPIYEWERVELPDSEWNKTVYSDVVPHTTVWTRK